MVEILVQLGLDCWISKVADAALIDETLPISRRPPTASWSASASTFDAHYVCERILEAIWHPTLPGCQRRTRPTSRCAEPWPTRPLAGVFSPSSIEFSRPRREPSQSFQPLSHLLACLCENQAAVLPPHQVGEAAPVTATATGRVRCWGHSARWRKDAPSRRVAVAEVGWKMKAA
jgi:hypothetical protein